MRNTIKNLILLYPSVALIVLPLVTLISGIFLITYVMRGESVLPFEILNDWNNLKYYFLFDLKKDIFNLISNFISKFQVLAEELPTPQDKPPTPEIPKNSNTWKYVLGVGAVLGVMGYLYSTGLDIFSGWGSGVDPARVVKRLPILKDVNCTPIMYAAFLYDQTLTNPFTYTILENNILYPNAVSCLAPHSVEISSYEGQLMLWFSQIENMEPMPDTEEWVFWEAQAIEHYRQFLFPYGGWPQEWIITNTHIIIAFGNNPPATFSIASPNGQFLLWLSEIKGIQPMPDTSAWDEAMDLIEGEFMDWKEGGNYFRGEWHPKLFNIYNEKFYKVCYKKD